MIKLSINKLSLLALTLVLGAVTITAQAHEIRRLSSRYVVQLGVDGEVDGVVGIDKGPHAAQFFAFYMTTPGDINTAVPLDKAAGDTVEIAALPAYFASENYNAAVTQFLFPILHQFFQTIIEATPAYQSENFQLNSSGAFGYFSVGSLKKKGKAKIDFIEKFVCGGGSKDTEFGTSFECVR
jgi:hypothetical protein